MLTQINPGAVLPFYREVVTSMAHTRHVTGHGDGWKILASNRRLIPFIFWRDTAPATVDRFQVVNIQTGKIHELDTGLITRRKRSDDSRTWYFYRDADISTVLTCGMYSIRVELSSGGAFISDAIEVIDLRGPESMRLDVSGCAADVLTLAATDNLVDMIDFVRLEYRYTSGTGWTSIPETAILPYVYEIDLASLSPPAGENVLLRRTVRTSVGNTMIGLWALDWDAGDPCGTYTFFQIEDSSHYLDGNLWILEISDSEKWEDKIYQSAFYERIYLRGHLDTPEIEREVENETNNTGDRILVTADTREIMVLQLEQIPDQLLWVLSSVPDYETITLYSAAKAVGFDPYTFGPLNRGEVEFSFEPGTGRYYSQGALKWRNRKHFERTCEETDESELVI